MNGRVGRWIGSLHESWNLAHDSIRLRPGRSILAILGVVIGIVTVVFVSAVLAGLRAQVALLFREFGTDNVFAYHRSGDPYAIPSEEEARRRPLDPLFAKSLAREGEHIQDVAVQLIVPPVAKGRPIIVRGGGKESETALIEGLSANFFDLTGAEFAAGRPFTEIEELRGARVAVLGANTARALFGPGNSVGRQVVFGGASFNVVGESAPRRGGFFGENRQDSVIAIPHGTAVRLFAEAKETVFYVRARAGERDLAYRETEAILRRLRGLGPAEPNDFNLSTADQIIAQLDRVSAAVGLATLALAAVSLVIGGIGIANVMLIAVAERTREIGLRMAIGARRRVVLRQFLLEATVLSFSGGVAGVLLAALLGLGLSLIAPGLFGAPPPLIVVAGLLAALGTGMVAGYGPAARASTLDPATALRHE